MLQCGHANQKQQHPEEHEVHEGSGRGPRDDEESCVEEQGQQVAAGPGDRPMPSVRNLLVTVSNLDAFQLQVRDTFVFVDIGSGRPYVCERVGNRFAPSTNLPFQDRDDQIIFLNALPRLKCRVKQSGEIHPRPRRARPMLGNPHERKS